MPDPVPTPNSAAPEERPRFACRRCAAPLVWDPGAASLACPYCGQVNEAPAVVAVETSEAQAARAEALAERDYRAFLAQLAGEQERVEVIATACTSCGAELTLRPNVVADDCPFCGSSVVRTTSSRRLIRPHAVLPFRITTQQAGDAYAGWLRGLWFAPNALKRQARRAAALHGVYVPHWTYDAHTETQYIGERGEHYYVTVSYTTTENGRTVQRQRRERRTRWYPARGRVSDDFDDVLVPASEALPRSLCEALEPWDLAALEPYADQFLSGFQAQSYTLDLEGGFERAKQIMEVVIRRSICRDIGGDEQRIHHLETRYDGITFKHLLLPVWVSAYRYRERIYRFLVNARTGEVQGERPWSWVKITFAVLLVLVVLAVGIYFQDGG
jgi:predicted RNA-binding Zn-ribbon protein involved in translation (DUF1610 family)